MALKIHLICNACKEHVNTLTNGQCNRCLAGLPPKRKAETIDATPTWEGILPLLLTAHEDGNAQGRKIALEELTRMAKLADAYVASQSGKEDLANAK